jgi:hypothetical protein
MLVANPAKARESTAIDTNGYSNNVTNGFSKTTDLSSSSYSNGVERNTNSLNTRLTSSKLSSELKQSSSSLLEQTKKEIRSSKLGKSHFWVMYAWVAIKATMDHLTRLDLLRKVA